MLETDVKFEVTLHVYSGRPDPSWVIDEHHARFNEIQNRLGEIPCSHFPNRLGYRGFTIRKIEPFPKKTHTLILSGHAKLETLLLETAPNLGYGLKEHVLSVINDKKGNGVCSTSKPVMGTERFGDLPRFEPQKWNTKDHQTFNNCYNYANDIISDTNAQPGRATQHPFPVPPQGKDVMTSAMSDGLKVLEAPDPDNLPLFSWDLVALVFWPPSDINDKWDYHMYRLDSDERHWSHKPGKTPAINCDNSGKPIKDPRYCNRGPYTEFVTFMETRKDKVKIV